MDVFSQAQVTVFTAGVTAIGVIVGLALDKHNPNLLLFISVLAPVLVSTHTDLRNRIGENGAYIGTKLWPYIRRLSRSDLPSWEEHWEYRVNKYLILVGVSQAPALLLATSFAVLAIRSGVVLHGHHQSSHGNGGYVVLWGVGMSLSILSGGYTAAVLNALRGAKANVEKSEAYGVPRGFTAAIRNVLRRALKKTDDDDEAPNDDSSKQSQLDQPAPALSEDRVAPGQETLEGAS
jgi:hypothetical protein